jgi:hypothetical protein
VLLVLVVEVLVEIQALHQLLELQIVEAAAAGAVLRQGLVLLVVLVLW